MNVKMFFYKLQSGTVPKDTYSPQGAAFDFLLLQVLLEETSLLYKLSITE